MDALLSITSFLGKLDTVWDDPAWIYFGLIAGVGILGLVALLALYPISRDVDADQAS